MTHVTGRCCDTGQPSSPPDLLRHPLSSRTRLEHYDPVGDRGIVHTLLESSLSYANALLHTDFDAICGGIDDGIAFSHFCKRAEQVTAMPDANHGCGVYIAACSKFRPAACRMHSISRRIVLPSFPFSILSLSADLKGVTFNDHRRLNHREGSGFAAEFAAAAIANIHLTRASWGQPELTALRRGGWRTHKPPQLSLPLSSPHSSQREATPPLMALCRRGTCETWKVEVDAHQLL